MNIPQTTTTIDQTYDAMAHADRLMNEAYNGAYLEYAAEPTPERANQLKHLADAIRGLTGGEGPVFPA
jgi:hypothetical protein